MTLLDFSKSIENDVLHTLKCEKIYSSTLSIEALHE